MLPNALYQKTLLLNFALTFGGNNSFCSAPQEETPKLPNRFTI
ncbi:MAG: hypothetical protein ACTSPP_09165 [Candidatus Heimdallarchaeaceae archaeon]